MHLKRWILLTCLTKGQIILREQGHNVLQFSKVFSIKLSSRNTNNGAAASFLAAAPYVLNGFRYCPYSW